MCTDTIPVLAYVKIELFFADICYYQRINPKPITDMAKKIAEQLIDTLAESGVERIYAVTGDSLNEVNEAVRKNNKIKWIHVRHEETGAYAAAAEAQLTGRPGCCAGSSGPGHVHLINGLYDAQRSGAPVIAIASTIPSREFGTEYFQETNTIKLFNDCSYYNEVATTPKQFPRMLQSAIQTAITRKGVAVVGLPGDLAKASAVSVDSSVRNYFTRPEVCPSEEDLILLADLLNSHERITLFCGIGCRGAHEEVIALSEKLNAPVAYTFKGKMEVQYENPYAMHPAQYEAYKSGKAKEDFLEDVAKRRAEKDKSPEEDAKPKTLTVQVDGQAYRVTVAYGDAELPATPAAAAAPAGEGQDVLSPLEGKFFLVKNAQETAMKVGDVVKEGDVLCYVEAMKTYNAIRAEFGGTITAICANPGDTVSEDDVLMKIG